MSSLCQICGRRFYDDDFTSNPLSHFCIGLDGPAIIHEEAETSAPHTPELEKPKEVVSTAHTIEPPSATHSEEDHAEIARLREEVKRLKERLVKRGHVSFV